jgi:hypothetical protein
MVTSSGRPPALAAFAGVGSGLTVGVSVALGYYYYTV